MALQQTKILDNGFSGNYWKISSLIDMDFINNRIDLSLKLYKDQTIREENPDGSIYILNYAFIGSDFKDFLGVIDIRAVAYTKILATDPFFQNALSV